MMIGTLLAMVKHDEQTQKIAKLRRQFRKGLASLHRSDKKAYSDMAISADTIWNTCKEELNDKNYVVDLVLALRVLYDFLDGSKYRNMFFTDNTFFKAVNSMDEITKEDVSYDVEESTNTLIDMFGRGLGVKQDSKLKLMRTNIQNDLILSGKVS